MLTLGRYMDAAQQEDDGELFEEKMVRLAAQWWQQREETARLDAAIEAHLQELWCSEGRHAEHCVAQVPGRSS